MKIGKQIFFLLVSLLLFANCQDNTQKSDWPEITSESKPWTRWWWHGSAVTKEGITSELEGFKKAGLGGVEITPIFGVRGTEDQFIDFLSPQWVDMLTYTLKEADRLGLGVDMATGTGWPFGGPWVDEDNASKNINYKTYHLSSGQSLNEPVSFTQKPMIRFAGKGVSMENIKYPLQANKNMQELAIDQVRYKKELPLVTLMAYANDGRVLNLTDKVKDSTLNWKAPDGEWTLYALFQGLHGKMVERAAPGGEGYVIDHFSKQALDAYFSKFDSAFQGRDIGSLRAFFNDSYEVDDARGEANWTPGFFEKFKAFNDYDLKEYLPALFGQADKETNARVLSDYRNTIGNLIYENFTKHWKEWAAKNGAIIRNQAHGSPANILDLYATVDIPETEGEDMLKIKFASSAANVMGKRLSSSESATWLNDHFLSSLADMRKNLERYLLGGINHVFYHGTAYSPDEAPWPGWLFYAAVHVDDRNTWWKDFPTLNNYLAHIQSFMQNSAPDNDLLVYFPIYDRYAEGNGPLLEHFDIRGNFNKSKVKIVGDHLLEKGYTFDFISDRQIQQLSAENGTLMSHGNAYKALLLPPTEYLPLETMKQLAMLKKQGVKVLFYKSLPKDVPGLSNLEERQAAFAKLKEEISETSQPGYSLDTLLTEAGITREEMVDTGLKFNRKKYEDGHCYFIVNWSNKPVDGFISLTKTEKNVAIFNPMAQEKGQAKTDESSVYLQMQPGSSCIVITSEKPISAKAYPYYEPVSVPINLNQPWQVTFTKGGPTLPVEQTLDHLKSWTTFNDTSSIAFSGTASYTTHFSKPKDIAPVYQLNLGEVHESATVYLNNQKLETLIGPNYVLTIPDSLLKDTNELKVEVTNLMANRIIYMDQNEIAYRKFYNVNFPAKKRENVKDGLFHADHWEPLPSGLIGPVSLTALKMKEF